MKRSNNPLKRDHAVALLLAEEMTSDGFHLEPALDRLRRTYGQGRAYRIVKTARSIRRNRTR